MDEETITIEDVKKMLKLVRLYDMNINSKLANIQRLREMATSVTASMKNDPVQTSGNSDKVGNAVCAIVDFEAEIDKEIDELIDLKRYLNDVINRLTAPDEVNVLSLRYFKYMTWEQIACEMGCTYRNVCYIHGRALQSVKKILEEI